MQNNNAWLLPEGIEQTLPDKAIIVESLRRKLLDMFACWGYQQVIPPMIDYLDSLLVGSGHDLSMQTFKMTDQLTGKSLGIRADMTPQVARMAGHNLSEYSPARLCYVGTVLHTVGDSLEKTRSPMQIGAELYGHRGLESDIEIIGLMLEMLAVAGVQNVHLDLGHVGIYRAICSQSALSEQQESELFDILQRKAIPELIEFIEDSELAEPVAKIIQELPKLNGGREILAKAKDLIIDCVPDAAGAIEELQRIADYLAVNYPSLPAHFDLSELRGYNYHTGVVFAALVPNVGKEIARGGRYDNISEVFGQARAATGFSADLKKICHLISESVELETQQKISAEYGEDADLLAKIRDLRAEGRVVIQRLPGQQAGAAELGCTAMLEKLNDQWVVIPINESE